MPGVLRLVKHLNAHKIPIVVATSSLRNNFKIKSSNNQELFSLFDDITCGDDPNVLNGKPAPDIFLAARAKAGNPPVSQCLVFEDALNGIQAARNAGMHVNPNLAALYPGDNGATEKKTIELFLAKLISSKKKSTYTSCYYHSLMEANKSR
ncbi:2801_t:CDS:2 [Diversispora eburnea]|uniref:2801_t:CDS:1 n=1 Tax=Diversispora eburnea TaxID=1213867 RepID=A0A9N9G843_9GLOM|nr:2801_t:CDS:2 [Diversispora eburnea]